MYHKVLSHGRSKHVTVSQARTGLQWEKLRYVDISNAEPLMIADLAVDENDELWQILIGNLRPARPKYNFTWDPQCVLHYFDSRPTNINSSILDISKKLVTLLALTTGYRLQTLRQISIDDIHISSTRITIFVPARIKTTGQRSTQPLLILPFFENSRVCAAHTLIQYLKATKSTHGSVKELFITSRPRPTREKAE